MKVTYIYVDESGQETRGRLFVVATIIIEDDRDELRKKLQLIEKQSKKRNLKWTNSTEAQRKKYIELLLDNTKFKKSFFYSKYEDRKGYDELTVLSTAIAIKEKQKNSIGEDKKVIVFVDGLQKLKHSKYAGKLRRLNIKTRKVRGLRDQSDEFIRLADSIAGFVRNYIEGKKWTNKLYKEAVAKGFLKEIKNRGF